MKNAASLLSCFCVLLATSHNSSAQVTVPSASVSPVSPDTLVPPFAGNYLAPLLSLRAAHDAYAASPEYRDLYFEDLATQESWVGNDAQAIADFDAAQPPEQLSASETAADVASLHGYNPVDARQTILRLAAQRQAVFINEAHHVPRHRAFTLTLLRGLYERGYRYFAAETLSDKDTGLQSRGYPTLRTGSYTAEPVFGDLVRTALHLGFKVVPYEYRPPGSVQDAADPTVQMNLRERGEAQNLVNRILKRDPHAKIVVHAGYGHIGKMATTVDFSHGFFQKADAPPTQFIPMALYFKRITGIDPLCVDQTVMMPHSAKAYENAVYQAVDNAGMMQEAPVVLQNVQGNLYVSPNNKGVFDMMVFTPRDTIEFGRPDWLSLNGARLPYQLPGNIVAPTGTSLLVQAFYANEPPATAIPIDQVEVNADTQALPALLLPRGLFNLQIVDAAGVVQRRWQVTIPLPDTPLP